MPAPYLCFSYNHIDAQGLKWICMGKAHGHFLHVMVTR